MKQHQDRNKHLVSIADATLASPQLLEIIVVVIEPRGFNRRRDACFPATTHLRAMAYGASLFQSQTRRLLPRNMTTPASIQMGRSFNRRRDACFPATGRVRAPVGI